MTNRRSTRKKRKLFIIFTGYTSQLGSSAKKWINSI